MESPVVFYTKCRPQSVDAWPIADIELYLLVILLGNLMPTASTMIKVIRVPYSMSRGILSVPATW